MKTRSDRKNYALKSLEIQYRQDDSNTFVSRRIINLKNDIQNKGYSICLERPALLWKYKCSKTAKLNKNSHLLIKRGHSLAYLFSNRKPVIYDQELIIGNMSSKRVAANYYPEGASFNIIEDIFRLSRRSVSLHLNATEKLKMVAIALITFRDSILFKALFRRKRIRNIWDILFAKKYIITEVAGVGHQIGDYESIIKFGLIRSD